MSDRERFYELAKQWHEDTDALSARREQHPAYQEMIAMGPAVIPLMLRQIECDGSHFYFAIRQLVDDPPVIPKHLAGRMREIQDIYVQWGRERGYLP